MSLVRRACRRNASRGMRRTPAMPTTTTNDEAVDAFILFNEQEDRVADIEARLRKRGIRTHFWRRDIPIGDDWRTREEMRLREARVVVVFLGRHGWGPEHLRF